MDLGAPVRRAAGFLETPILSVLREHGAQYPSSALSQLKRDRRVSDRVRSEMAVVACDALVAQGLARRVGTAYEAVDV